MTTMLLLLLCLFVFTIILELSDAIPLTFLTSGAAKCYSVEEAQDTVIRILYEVPDLLNSNDPNYGPIYIQVSTRPAHRVLDTKLHPSPIQQRLKPINQIIQDKKGSLVHKFEVDGTASVCIRATNASMKRPIRVGLRVIETADEESVTTTTTNGEKDGGNNLLDEDGDEHTEGVERRLDDHLSHMETEFKRIQIAMNVIRSHADFSKDREALFHKQTKAMHNATMFWPIVQLCVLIMTGFTQASHIVNFFKSRRII